MTARCTLAVLAAFVGIATPVNAGELRIDGPLIQGGLVRGATEPNAEVYFEGQRVRVSPAGVFLIGFGRDDTGTFTLKVRHPDGSSSHRHLDIAERDYPVRCAHYLLPA